MLTVLIVSCGLCLCDVYLCVVCLRVWDGCLMCLTRGLQDAWVAPDASPARATVGGVKLADPGWKVEIVVTAALP